MAALLSPIHPYSGEAEQGRRRCQAPLILAHQGRTGGLGEVTSGRVKAGRSRVGRTERSSQGRARRRSGATARLYDDGGGRPLPRVGSSGATARPGRKASSSTRRASLVARILGGKSLPKVCRRGQSALMEEAELKFLVRFMWLGIGAPSCHGACFVLVEYFCLLGRIAPQLSSDSLACAGGAEAGGLT